MIPVTVAGDQLWVNHSALFMTALEQSSNGATSNPTSTSQPRVFVPSESGDASVVRLKYIWRSPNQTIYQREKSRYGARAATCTSDHEEQQNNETADKLT